MNAAFEALVPLIPLVMLVSLRVGIALASLPAPLGSLAPMQVRAALGLLLALVITIPHAEAASSVVLDPFWMASAALSEALVGASIGLTARLCLAAAEIAGEVVGGSIGLGFAQQVDPSSGHEVAATARVLEMLAVMTFFAANGHHAVIAALAESLALVPPGAGVGEALRLHGVELGTGLVGAGLRIASPVLGTMLVVQLAIAITSRAAPRLQVFSLSFAIAASVGLLTIVVSMTAISEAIHHEVDALPARLLEIVSSD
ncbi:MAG: flagellar biosynthetic protein FliR [Deltaproteobacteria bacterium]|nr:flagellar biosynthetic protein FliR [Deltaproteobacteria bacterium]